MRFPRLILAVAFAAGAVPLAAQAPDTERPYSVSVSVGSFGFPTFQSQGVVAYRQSPSGVAMDSALLRRGVDADGGAQLLASAVAGFGGLWAARVGVGYGRTTLATGYSAATAADTLWVISAEALSRQETTRAEIVTGEVALRRWVPTRRRIRPYVELGAAALRLETVGRLAGAEALSAGVMRIAGLAAAGGHVSLTDRLSARVQASARFFRTPIDPAPTGTEGGSTSTLRTTFRPPAARSFADDATELATALRLEIGVSFGLGPAPEPARDEDPEADREPGPDRGVGPAAAEPSSRPGSGGSTSP